eukprot:1804836-Pyramimonas_sp.AAC.1
MSSGAEKLRCCADAARVRVCCRCDLKGGRFWNFLQCWGTLLRYVSPFFSCGVRLPLRRSSRLRLSCPAPRFLATLPP